MVHTTQVQFPILNSTLRFYLLKCTIFIVVNYLFVEKKRIQGPDCIVCSVCFSQVLMQLLFLVIAQSIAIYLDNCS